MSVHSMEGTIEPYISRIGCLVDFRELTIYAHAKKTVGSSVFSAIQRVSPKV